MVAGVKEEEEPHRRHYPRLERPTRIREDELRASMNRAGVPVGCYKLPEPRDSPPSVAAAAAASGWMAISVVAIESGFHFPFHPFVSELLRRWDVSPGQLTPSAWRAVSGFCVLCHAMAVEFSVNLFAHWASTKKADPSSPASYYKISQQRASRTKKEIPGLLGLRATPSFIRDYKWEARWFLLKLHPAADDAVDYARWRPLRTLRALPLSPEEQRGWDRLVAGYGRPNGGPARAEDFVRSPAFLEWLRVGHGGVLPPVFYCWYRDAAAARGDFSGEPVLPRRRWFEGGGDTYNKVKRTRRIDGAADGSSESAAEEEEQAPKPPPTASKSSAVAMKNSGGGEASLQDYQLLLLRAEALIKEGTEIAREVAERRLRAAVDGGDVGMAVPETEELLSQLEAAEDRCEELEARVAATELKVEIADEGGFEGTQARRRSGMAEAALLVLKEDPAAAELSTRGMKTPWW